MTRHTGAYDLCMVHGNARLPERGAVTILTRIRGLNMRHTFAGRFVTVVTAEAISNDSGMVENSWHPSDRLVAIVTGFAGNDVIRRLTGSI